MTGALNSLQFEVSALKAMAELLRDQPTTTEHLDALSASMVALEIESDLLRDRITNCREYQNERACSRASPKKPKICHVTFGLRRPNIGTHNLVFGATLVLKQCLKCFRHVVEKSRSLKQTLKSRSTLELGFQSEIHRQ